MTLRRILKYVNLAIAGALGALLVAVYWYAWRPLSQTDGQIAAPVAARGTIARDSIGVPHILAANQPDMLFLQGYATAQDRLFQMDLLRRVAAGELAEVAGKAALESDRESRRLRLARIAEDCERQLPADQRAVLAAYARGVNHYIETHRGRLPLDFTLMRYTPRPWGVTDSLLVYLNMVNTLERTRRFEIRKESLLAGGAPEKAAYLFAGDAASPDLLPGSNAWALSGKLTATGQPILAGDPHLEISTPSIWHMVHLRGPRMNVTGATMPGLPGVLIGHNDRIAWSITSLEADTQDLYVEKLNPANGLYEYQGRVERARAERELIRASGAGNETMVIWVTRHGPVVAAEDNRFMALRWTAADAAGFQLPVLEINRARTWEEFRAGLARLPGPAVNFVYADAAGNIGHQVAGRLPNRKGFDGSVPVDGSSGDYEWDGVIPFDKLPSTFNPPSGMIVSANQNPFPPGYPYRASGYFATPYRFRQIRDRLRSRTGWKAEEMLAIQTDVYSSFAHWLAREIVAAHGRHAGSYPALAEAAAILHAWNGQMAPGEAAPMIATLAARHLRASITRLASPSKPPVAPLQASTLTVERLLREKPSGWVQDYDRFLLDNVADALDEGRRIQGRDPSKWNYGRFNRMVLDNPVAGRLPLVGKYFNIGEVRMGGSPESPLQKPPEAAFGPSMRMVVDFSDFDKSMQNIPIGQSGQILSRHYRDQWDAYHSGRSFPMQFNKVDASNTLVVVPETP